jgi:hypothetical protein
MIMPFGGWNDEYYEQIFKPAILEAGMEPHRADDLYRPGAIVQDIWAYTKAAMIVLADLSHKNPNVLYELGLAHAIGKPVIMVSESVEDIPFDLRALRVLEYDKNAPDCGEALKAKIVQAIGEVLGAPTAAVPPAFLEADECEARLEVSPLEKEVLALRQELESLKQRTAGGSRRDRW